MHHYQYRSVFQSRRKASLNGNNRVNIDRRPDRQNAYNIIEDRAAEIFVDVIQNRLRQRQLKGPNGILKRSITLITSCNGSVSHMNETLQNILISYPISRASFIIGDAGPMNKEVEQFVDGFLEFPINIKLVNNTMPNLSTVVDIAGDSNEETEFTLYWGFESTSFLPGLVEESIDILQTDDDVSYIAVIYSSKDDSLFMAPKMTRWNRPYFVIDAHVWQLHENPRCAFVWRTQDCKRLRPILADVQLNPANKFNAVDGTPHKTMRTVGISNPMEV